MCADERVLPGTTVPPHIYRPRAEYVAPRRMRGQGSSTMMSPEVREALTKEADRSHIRHVMRNAKTKEDFIAVRDNARKLGMDFEVEAADRKILQF